MHRLLQGDVGAGKTIVAVSAMLAAVQGGHQGALMAPTEVLAEQHAVGIRKLLAGLQIPATDNLFGEREVRVELLTSSVTAERRRDVLAGLADGSIDIAIGTHALIQESVQFHSLGVVVVDEQHRFGVEQRAALRDKGEDGGAVPDVLVMTATPIPRTAAMTVYGDLDVSVLDQKPPGRTPIVTKHALGDEEEAEVWADVRAEVAAGRQAYIVCPLIEESEKLEVASAEETIARLAFDELKGLRLALLHGRMSSAEKESVMEAFRTGETDVLVATTVIEVGVDVHGGRGVEGVVGAGQGAVADAEEARVGAAVDFDGIDVVEIEGNLGVAGEVADGKAAHQQEQQMPAIQARAEDRQQGGSDQHAQGIAADHMADLGFADTEVLGDIGHQPHDGEFAGADGEAAERQGQLDQDDRAGRQAWGRTSGGWGHGKPCGCGQGRSSRTVVSASGSSAGRPPSGQTGCRSND